MQVSWVQVVCATSRYLVPNVTTEASPRIALVHALRASVEPIETALHGGWPDVDALHLMDDALPRDLERAGGRVDRTIGARFVVLARYAVSAGAEGILFTCSAFGPAIAEAKRAVDVPVFSPHEAMVDDAAKVGTVIALVATFPPTLPAVEAEIVERAKLHGREVDVVPVLVEGALGALQAGDGRAHDERIRDAVARAVDARPDVDVVALGQFSMARAAPTVRDAFPAVRTTTTPDAAVAALRASVVRQT